MMARSDDLAPLFAPAPLEHPAVTIRQGTVLSWDPVTFANTIQVGGAVLTNLPVLVGATIAVDDVVTILCQGPSWGVLGRFAAP